MNLKARISDAATSLDRSITVIRALDVGTLMVGLPGSSPRSVRFPHQTKGEAVTFSLDGRYLFLTSEGVTDLIRVPVSSL